MRVALCGVASSAPMACLGVEWWTLRRVEGSGAEAVSGVEECGSHAPNVTDNVNNDNEMIRQSGHASLGNITSRKRGGRERIL